MSFRLVPKSVTLNDLERRSGSYLALFLRNLVVSGANCVKVVDKTITMDNLRILCLVVNVCRGTARCPPYKNSITTRWKFCSRFINTGLKAHYMPSYHLDRKSYMSFRLLPKSSAEGPRDATGILCNCEVEIL